jgi:redox-sensing transcriptional repressor
VVWVGVHVSRRRMTRRRDPTYYRVGVVLAREIPDATVSRLPIYRRSLVELVSQGQVTVSSARLAELAGVNAAKVRKDLSYLGTYGVRGVGYDVEYLLAQVGEALGLDVEAPVVIVGMGNLGQALAHYGGFSSRGFPIVGLIDASSDKVGMIIDGIEVAHIDALPELVDRLGVSVGIISTPASAAQEVADALVHAGVRSILTFAPTVLQVPDSVPLRKVDVATELQILSYYQQRGGERNQTA